MNTFSALKTSVAKLRDLINSEMEPEAGVWGIRIPPGALKAQAAVFGVVIAVFVGVVMVQEGQSRLWNPFALFLGSLATLGPSSAFARVLDKKSERTPSNGTFFGWALASVVVGIPVGHLALFALNSLHAIGDEPMPLTYVPEFVMAAAIPFSYWRLFSVREWQHRLDTEKLKREAAEHGQALAQAQLKMLQAQIEAHFLFNTLASVQHLVRKDAQLADFLLSQLIRYLRQAVPDIRGMGSTLGREFGLVEAYLNIVRVRLDGRLEIRVSIPSELADMSFPPLVSPDTGGKCHQARNRAQARPRLHPGHCLRGGCRWQPVHRRQRHR